MRNVKIQHDMGVIKKEESKSDDARLPEEEERRLSSGVTQVQSRFFEGKVVHCQNADIANEWSDLVKRERASDRTVNVGGMTLVISPAATPEPEVKKTAETGKKEVNQKNGTTSADAAIKRRGYLEGVKRRTGHRGQNAINVVAEHFQPGGFLSVRSNRSVDTFRHSQTESTGKTRNRTSISSIFGISLNLFGPAWFSRQSRSEIGTLTSSEAP